MISKSPFKKIRPDSKGRIALGKLIKDISSFEIELLEDGKILLKPYVEIPKEETWLYNNKEALESVKRGILNSANRQLKKRESFSKYILDKD